MIGSGQVGVGWKCHFSLHNLSIISPAERNFEHNTLVSQVTPESIILYFTSKVQQTLAASVADKGKDKDRPRGAREFCKLTSQIESKKDCHRTQLNTC